MLYIYQIDITSTIQTLDEFNSIIEYIFSEIHVHIHHDLNPGNRHTILTNENPESAPFSPLVQSKLDAMILALQRNQHIRASVTVQSLFSAPGGAMQSSKLELLHLTQRDRSLLMTLYYGMQFIGTLVPYMTPIIFELHGTSIEMSSLLHFFLTRNASTTPAHLIPFGMILRLKSVNEHYCAQIAGSGLANTRYFEYMQMMMAPYKHALQPFIDLCQELKRPLLGYSVQPVTTLPYPIPPSASHHVRVSSPHLFFPSPRPPETIRISCDPLLDKRALDTSLDYSPPLNIALDYDEAAVEALMGIKASSCQPEPANSVSVLPSYAERATHIDLNNKQEVDRWAAENNFTYIHDESSAADLMIDRVAVFGPCEKSWGVYTKQSIEAGTQLGEYKGVRISLTDAVTNFDYIFKLSTEDVEQDTAEAIDAREIRNWTAFVNTSPSFETANIAAFVGINPKTHLRSIFYESVRAISEGDQLLLYYGADYVLSKIRYLNPKNTVLESTQIFQKNVQHYLPEAQRLPLNFVRLFNISDQQLFKVVSFLDALSKHSPSRIKRTRIAADEQCPLNVDLPFLALTHEQDDHASFLPQKEQENITALLLACWSGHLEMIEFLLQNHANPNLQSSIQGIYALHIIVASDEPFNVKKAMFNLFYAPERTEQPSLHLQDQKNQTVLHWAIKKQDVRLVKFLLTLDREIQKQSKENHKQNKNTFKSNLMNCIDDDDRDPFLLSLFLGSHDIAQELFHQTCRFDAFGNYLRNESLDLLGSYMEEESIDLWVASLNEYYKKTGDMDLIESILTKIEKTHVDEAQKKQIRDLVSSSSSSTLKMKH